ncbi:hypothetical protein COCNU_04G012690 [Cocos nucifera]|uniref:Uncharacterized protein n=1 Tax=Cocos nucifera TaxID=13894 RepID=A0A8K0I6M9_COCNU|nr:hypothetical protein COCNU_04G012690 [Cocos nucifera]
MERKENSSKKNGEEGKERSPMRKEWRWKKPPREGRLMGGFGGEVDEEECEKGGIANEECIEVERATMKEASSESGLEEKKEKWMRRKKKEVVSEKWMKIEEATIKEEGS